MVGGILACLYTKIKATITTFLWSFLTAKYKVTIVKRKVAFQQYKLQPRSQLPSVITREGKYNPDV